MARRSAIFAWPSIQIETYQNLWYVRRSPFSQRARGIRKHKAAAAAENVEATAGNARAALICRFN